MPCKGAEIIDAMMCLLPGSAVFRKHSGKRGKPWKLSEVRTFQLFSFMGCRGAIAELLSDLLCFSSGWFWFLLEGWSPECQMCLCVSSVTQHPKNEPSPLRNACWHCPQFLLCLCVMSPPLPHLPDAVTFSPWVPLKRGHPQWGCGTIPAWPWGVPQAECECSPKSEHWD